ncbi:Dipeptidyl peptidase IV [Pseudohaliea rubra DSM 19751]|uniref:Dipeptidyl peptidase IV n=2 Tax=Pseudohaliea TaxID=1341120 RepID=A0A095VSL3_9GAMM|nr:Dipeptidyl peptidase IV [Pseudohaliea rubra DSM 19751]
MLLLALCLLPGLARAGDGAGKPLNLETIFASDTFTARLPAALQWLPAGGGYARLGETGGGQVIVRRDPVTGEESILPLGDIPGLPADFRVSDFQWHPGSGFLLLKGPASTDWQGYESALWYVYQVADERLRLLGEPGQALQLVKLSPDGRHAGFVFANNLLVVELASGERRRVTRDGNQDIFNGIFDYGSTEFGWVDGWRWSPDSKRLAFWRMDATAVPRYPLIDELHSYSRVRDFHYPNTGEVHAVNTVHVFDLRTAETTAIDIGHDPDDYLPQLHWDSTGEHLYVQHLTRDHKTLRLWRAGADGEGIELLHTDTDPAWLDITDDLRPLADGSVLWTSEASGWRHLYRINVDGKARPLTRGEWTVGNVIGVDEVGGWAYFYAKRESLIDQHVYRVPLSGGPVERLTTEAGWHRWQLSPDGLYALATHSDARTPPTLALRAADGETLTMLVDDAVPRFGAYAMAHTEFVTFRTDDGIELNGFFIKPADFNPSKKYPVIAYGYGNAGSQVVVNRWGTQRGPTQDLWHRYLAQEGYVVFAMDNRTTAGRGKVAKNLTYGEYGKWAVLDYIEGVDYLKSLPWVDGDRIGFWGWSGGGYLAAALMTKAAPLFKVAVSVAPVIDLTRYQAVGVERWMGTPEENPDGYARVNLMNYADRLQGKLLLMHGTGDENVKFSFTLQFADALIRANRQFDMLVYPNQRHGIADHRLHVFTTMTRYFREHL